MKYILLVISIPLMWDIAFTQPQQLYVYRIPMVQKDHRKEYRKIVDSLVAVLARSDMFTVISDVRVKNCLKVSNYRIEDSLKRGNDQTAVIAIQVGELLHADKVLVTHFEAAADTFKMGFELIGMDSKYYDVRFMKTFASKRDNLSDYLQTVTYKLSRWRDDSLSTDTLDEHLREARRIVHTYPVPISMPKPVYPSEFIHGGLGGKVFIAFIINSDGNVEKAKILISSGFITLDDAALEAVAQWRFTPPLDYQGKPMNIWVSQYFTFEIK